jgi:alpha-methylacyl-CoA racemase
MTGLDGVRVVSTALNVPGPAALARLAALGAHAVKIEPPSGDPLAGFCPTWYAELHGAVAGIERLDRKTPAGRAALEHRLDGAEVLLTSQRPAALARLGLEPTALWARHPRLRMVRIVGDTSAPDRPGHDLSYQAEAGLLGDTLPRTLMADLLGAERAVSAVLLALRGAPGTCLDVGLRDAVATLAPPLRHGLTAPGGPLGGGDPAYRVYAARDGLVALAAIEPHFRSRLYAALERPVNTALDEVMAARTTAEWVAFAATHDLPLSVVRHRE